MKKIVVIAGGALAGTGAALLLKNRVGGWLKGSGTVDPIAYPKPGAGSGDTNDPTLVSRVESEIFRESGAAKGQVNVNAQFGVVQLRGEVDSQELIDDLVARARSVQGVVDVENLLHAPGDAAPMHQ